MEDRVKTLSKGLLELRSVGSVGGGRGVFACVDLQPGQLLLREQPAITLPHDKADKETLHMALARAIVSHPAAHKLWATLQPLHPTALSDLEPHVLATVKQQHADNITQLLSIIQKNSVQCSSKYTSAQSTTAPTQDTADPHVYITAATQPQTSTVDSAAGGDSANVSVNGTDGSQKEGSTVLWGEDTLLRLLLVLRLNAHPSGLYLASEMFNHQCCPNAIKLAVGGGRSEVRALRPIPAGSEVCISYLHPALMSYIRRCALLDAQHFFTPSLTHGYPSDMEAWSDQAVSTGVSDESLQSQLQALEDSLDRLHAEAESACDVLQRRVQRLSALQRGKGARGRSGQSEAAGTGQGDQEGPAQAAASATEALCRVGNLLSQVCAARRTAARLLHPRHVCLARTHELLVSLATAATSAAPQIPATPASAADKGASPGGMRRAKVPTLPFIIDLTWGDPTVMHTHTDTTSTAQNGRGGHDTQQSGSAGGHDTQQSPSPAASVTQQSSRAGGGVEGHDTQKGASNGVDGAQQGGAGGAGLSGAQEDDGTGVCDTQEQCVDCVDLALMVLRACEELRATQALYAGPGHYDTLRTLLDTQQCLEYLLGTAPKRLYGAFPDTYRNFTAASRAASTLSREYQKALAAWE